VAAHEIGFDTLFFYTWDIREKVMDLMETLTGNRVNYAMLTIGGVRRDFLPEQMTVLEDTLDYYRELFDRTREILLDDITIQMRCRDVGVLTYEEAVAYCAVGPTARASGLLKDVRVDYPMNAYPDIPWLKPVSPRDLSMEPRGDVFDRMIVRVLEMKQSIDIVQFCMDNMPEGPVALETKAIKLINQLKKIKGDGIGRYEAPRGEVAHYDILNEREGPVQVKVKAPTYSNAASWALMFKNAEIADIPIVMSSIDPCVACADRMSTVNGRGEKVTYTAAELHRMSVEKQKRISRR
jgi:membrane-bound hydrogenase subunit alpha